MKKLIVDLMRHTEEADIENIEISEEEIARLTKNLDLKAVKDRAIEGIRMESNVLKDTRKKFGFKKVAAVLVAAMAIGGTVVAAEYFDNFKFFYGEKANISAGDRASINKTATASGIKMTLSESVASDKGAIIMLTFEKEDGTALPKKVAINTLDIKENKDLSYMVNQKVSEDGKKLIVDFEIDSTKKLEGKKITVTADEMINTETNEKIAKGPWEISSNISAKAKTVEKKLDLIVGTGDEKLRLNKISVSTLGVSFEGIKDNGDIEHLPKYEPIVKITTVSGTSIQLKWGSANEIKNGFRLMYDLDSESNKIFLDLPTIKNIIVDDKVININ